MLIVGPETKEEEYYSFHKEPIGCIVTPRAKSNFWPTMPSSSRGVIKNVTPVGTIIMLVA